MTCRSEKESLQCSLLAAQQHVMELERDRNELEGQVHSATQAMELILGESLMCFVSGYCPALCSCSKASTIRRVSEERRSWGLVPSCLTLKGLEVSRVLC